jgi:outer membrane protein with beta-barrel domain
MSWKAFLVALGAAALLQTPAQGQSFGAKVGPTLSTIDLHDVNLDSNPMLAFGGGAFIRFALFGISFQPEVLLVGKGADLEDVAGVAVELKLNYLEVPLLARFGYPVNRRLTGYVMTGPTFSFQYDCRFDIGEGDFDNFDCDQEDSIFLERNSFDVGLTGVLGFEYRLGPGAVLLEGRYTHGLRDIADEHSVVNSFDGRNRSAAVFGGYSFPFSVF